MTAQSKTVSRAKYSALAAKINRAQPADAADSVKEVKALLATKELFKSGMVATMDGEPRYM